MRSSIPLSAPEKESCQPCGEIWVVRADWTTVMMDHPVMKSMVHLHVLWLEFYSISWCVCVLWGMWLKVKEQLRAVSFLLPPLGSQASAQIRRDAHWATSLGFVVTAVHELRYRWHELVRLRKAARGRHQNKTRNHLSLSIMLSELCVAPQRRPEITRTVKLCRWPVPKPCCCWFELDLSLGHERWSTAVIME